MQNVQIVHQLLPPLLSRERPLFLRFLQRNWPQSGRPANAFMAALPAALLACVWARQVAHLPARSCRLETGTYSARRHTLL